MGETDRITEYFESPKTRRLTFVIALGTAAVGGTLALGGYLADNLLVEIAGTTIWTPSILTVTTAALYEFFPSGPRQP